MPPPRVFHPRQSERDVEFKAATSQADVQMLLKAWSDEDRQAEHHCRRLDDIERRTSHDRLEALAARVEVLEASLVPHDDCIEALIEAVGEHVGKIRSRLDVLEQRDALTYTGIWDETRFYSRGCACSHNGSLFVAVADCAPGERPNRAATWRLAIKGADPKGERSPVVA
jgi:hypothetical protein